MSDSLFRLKTRLAQIIRLGQAASVLSWDQQTYMPTGGAASRAEQLATLSQFTHELFVSPEVGALLAQAEADTQGEGKDSDAVRLLRNVRRSYNQETKLPVDLVMELARHSSLAQEIWQQARKENNFAVFAPALEKMIALTREKAEHLGYKDHIYDALIDLYEPGTTQASVAAMFNDLKPELVALTRAIASSPNTVDDSLLHGDFPIEKQKEVTLQFVRAVGYSLERGRQDIAAHPFCTHFSRDDVRITTRFDARFLPMSVYASLHEAGHAMYEQGSPPEYEGTALAGGTSLGVHESQSRLWENLVGRSREFCGWSYPQLQAAFPDVLGRVGVDAYYRAINKVEPSLIRVEADEVTYNLHILLRFELECDLLTGKLAVSDLPATWNAKMQEMLGITPPNDADGVLQDVHWSCGLVGYFPTYSIGNLLSAQLWEALRKVLPDVNAQIARGEFAPLLDWLRANVHGYGSKYLPGELVVKATGEPLSSRPYLAYLKSKFAGIYGL